jgi:hypothetical protein
MKHPSPFVGLGFRSAVNRNPDFEHDPAAALETFYGLDGNARFSLDGKRPLYQSLLF